MWQVNVTCSGEAWKLYAADFKAMIEKYTYELVVSKKLPNEQRIMGYKIEDVSDAESFVEDSIKFPGFTADFESF